MTHGCVMTQNSDRKYICKEELLCTTIKKSNEIINCSKYAVSVQMILLMIV